MRGPRRRPSPVGGHGGGGPQGQAVAVDSCMCMGLGGACRAAPRRAAEPLSFTPRSWDAAAPFSPFSDRSWGLFTVAMATFISIAAALLFLRGK